MTTQIGKNIEQAREYLLKGEVVAIPTETVYGLAGNALNEEAVIKIFEAKNRPHFNPLIIHLPFWNDVKNYTTYIPEHANTLAMHFSPGPITYLLPKKSNVPDIITAGSGKVAVRIPAHPVALQLLRAIDFPLAAPSANQFGYVSPTTPEHVLSSLKGKIPFILDGGNSNIGVESTIVDFENDEVIIRRNGGISKEEIEDALGFAVSIATEASDHPVAPGQLKSHYATNTPLYLVEPAQLLKHKAERIITIGFGSQHIAATYNLSVNNDLHEAAKMLFQTLRLADAINAEAIYVSKVPGNGIGMAINDRLQRAQHQMK